MEVFTSHVVLIKNFNLKIVVDAFLKKKKNFYHIRKKRCVVS